MRYTTFRALIPLHSQHLLQYVDAKSGESFPLYNPADESVLHSNVPIAGQADVDAAVAGAQAA